MSQLVPDRIIIGAEHFVAVFEPIRIIRTEILISEVCHTLGSYPETAKKLMEISAHYSQIAHTGELMLNRLLRLEAENEQLKSEAQQMADGIVADRYKQLRL